MGRSEAAAVVQIENADGAPPLRAIIIDSVDVTDRWLSCNAKAYANDSTLDDVLRLRLRHYCQ